VPDVKIVAATSPDRAEKPAIKPDIAIDTIYEPDPVKQVKAPKLSASKQAAPIVKALLSGIKRSPTVSHHPTCSCGMCKPA
jgi:hypothetical protein